MGSAVAAAAAVVAALVLGIAAPAAAAPAGGARGGIVVGRLELPPPPERGPVIAKGFVDRIENPLADVKKPNLAPYLIVALEPADADKKTDAAPAQVNWDLVGESFVRPVVAVPVGAEVVIKNTTKVARTIAAAEDANLLAGPFNPTATKSFRATQPAIYTVADPDAPHLHGKIVVVATSHVASVDDAGRFEITDVPDGSYKLRVFYYDPIAEAHGKRSDWLAVTADVTVSPRGRSNRTEVTLKLPPLTTAAVAPAAPAPPGKK